MNIKIIALLLIIAIAFVSFVDSMPDPGKKYGGSSHAPYYNEHDEDISDEHEAETSTAVTVDETTTVVPEASNRMDSEAIYFGLLSSLASPSASRQSWMDDGGYSPVSSYAAEVDSANHRNPLKDLFRQTVVDASRKDSGIRGFSRHVGLVSDATAPGFFDDDDIEDEERDGHPGDQHRASSRPQRNRYGGGHEADDGLGYLSYSVVYSGRRQADDPVAFDTDYLFFRDGDDPSAPAALHSTVPASTYHHADRNTADYELGDYPTYEGKFVDDVEAEDDDDEFGNSKRGVRGAQGYASFHEVSRITGDISGIGTIFDDYAAAAGVGEYPDDGTHHHIHSHTHKHAVASSRNK